ncbi:MAG TPA: MATE family efflux transporter [Burkholderiaceae bacterium]|nr:MATE family efflux transporter [Burkholderiaceae bacterium]
MSEPAETSAPASGAIVAQAWPMLVAQLAFILNFTIDTAMAGRLSAVQLAGVSLGSNLYVSIAIAMIGVLSALGPIAAQHFGAGRSDQVGRDVHQAIWLAAFLSLPGCAALIWHNPWIRMAEPGADVAQVTSAYLTAAAFGLPGALGARVFVTLNSALSRPQFTMAINLTALLLKVPLNALFIWGAGPLPALGGPGCAVATACQSWLTFGLGLAVWRWHPYFKPFRRTGAQRSALPQWQLQKELLRIGVPAGLSTLFEVTSFTLMAVLVARLGAATLSGHQIVGNIAAILFMVPLSMGFASSALVAQALGACNPRRARTLSVNGLRLAAAGGLTLALLTWLAREPIIAAYTTDPQIAAQARRLIGLAAAFHTFDALQSVSVFVLRGYKVTFAPMLIYGVSLWGIGLGGGYWLAYRGLFSVPPLGSVGLWTAALIGLSVAATCLVCLTLYVSRRRVEEFG